jgi:uncharacterized membrane protein YdfJ with MMPL/SSD domain
MLASLTLLPAMLGFLGPKVLRRAERAERGAAAPRASKSGGFWLRWAEGLGRRPRLPAVLALVVLAVLAIPLFSWRAGLLDASTDPASSTTYQAYELLAKGFGPGFNGPLEVVGQVNRPADHAHFAAFVASATDEPGVARVLPPQLSPNSRAEVAVVYPTTGPQDAATTALLDRLRSNVPRAEKGTTLAIHIGGTTAASEDFSQVLNSKMVQFVAVVVGLSTDYEVFLVSRMHEEWARTGDNRRAVIRGQAETGRVITAASLIMILVFASFIFGGEEATMQIGLGFAAAIFVDAYIIRTVLVPSVMHLLGRSNWWIPAPLDRILPRLNVEPAENHDYPERIVVTAPTQ